MQPCPQLSPLDPGEETGSLPSPFPFPMAFRLKTSFRTLALATYSPAFPVSHTAACSTSCGVLAPKGLFQSGSAVSVIDFTVMFVLPRFWNNNLGLAKELHGLL